eukprot:1158627-Pelagomonas_calceolata.AAC.1
MNPSSAHPGTGKEIKMHETTQSAQKSTGKADAGITQSPSQKRHLRHSQIAVCDSCQVPHQHTISKPEMETHGLHPTCSKISARNSISLLHAVALNKKGSANR